MASEGLAFERGNQKQSSVVYNATSKTELHFSLHEDDAIVLYPPSHYVELVLY